MPIMAQVILGFTIDCYLFCSSESGYFPQTHIYAKRQQEKFIQNLYGDEGGNSNNFFKVIYIGRNCMIKFVVTDLDVTFLNNNGLFDTELFSPIYTEM